MKRALVPAGALVLLLALSGCVSVETSESRVEVTPGASGTYSSGDTTVVVEPLTAETPSASAGTERDETVFVATVRDTLRAENVIPGATDEQLVEAGTRACEMKSSGVAAEDITVIDGEERGISGYYLDSFKIYQAAAESLC